MRWSQRFGFEKTNHDHEVLWYTWVLLIWICVFIAAGVVFGFEPREGARCGAWFGIMITSLREGRDLWSRFRMDDRFLRGLPEGPGDWILPVSLAGVVLWMT